MISDIHPQRRLQLSLLDQPQRKAKEQALAKVESNANEEFKRVALKTIHSYALSCPQISANDVWHSLDQLGVETHENRALGAMFLKAAKAGWIEKTNMTLASNRKTRHCGDVRIWRSLIFGNASTSELLTGGRPLAKTCA